MIEDFRYARVVPHCRDRLAHLRLQHLLRIRVDRVLHDIFAVLLVLSILHFDLELPHRAYQRFRAVDDVLVDGMPVQHELVLRVAILVNDLHLLDDGALPTLPGPCIAALVADHTCLLNLAEVTTRT